MSPLYRLLLLLLFPLTAIAQPVPPYTVTALDPGSSGYYFLTPIRTAPLAGFAPSRMILDSNGRLVYYAPFPVGSGDFKVQPNGMMSWSRAGKFYLMDSTFTVVDSVVAGNSLKTDTHDLQILPNGNFLVMAYEYLPMDLSSYPLFNGNGTRGSRNAVIESGVIQEVDPRGKVLFEWHAYEHYEFEDADPFFLDDTVDVDWTHFNAVALDADGNILVSVRHFNEITKIDRTTGEIIWRLGGRANQFDFLNDSAMFLAQHDIRRLAGGTITLLDNGRRGDRIHPAAAKEYSLDEAARTATLVWSYIDDPFRFSNAIGNVQRLANGNTLVNQGFVDDQNALFMVVDPDGRKIFEIAFADTLRSYRVYNHQTLPWALPRPRITCDRPRDELILDAGAGYSRYLWSNGATTRTIAALGADTFSVLVSLPDGGLIRSEPFIVSDPSNPCVASSVPVAMLQRDSSPEPAIVSGEIVIELPGEPATDLTVTITDLVGRTVYITQIAPRNGRLHVSLGDLRTGFYHVAAGRYRRSFLVR